MLSFAAMAYQRPGSISRVSVASDGTQAENFFASAFPYFTPDGRYVTFTSAASNLVPGDTNGASDVFIHDRLTAVTERVSLADGGGQASGGGSTAPAPVSADGRFVVFASNATNFVAGDTNGFRDVFVRDRQSGSTELISVSSTGERTNSHSGETDITADGRFVVFQTDATNLVQGDTNGVLDAFIHDRSNGTTDRVSVAADGTQGNALSGGPYISADGRFVVFSSLASNLVPSDTNGVLDTFVKDRETGVIERISIGVNGEQGNALSGTPTPISADGRFVVFASNAANLIPGDSNGRTDVYLRDRLMGTTERVSVGSFGQQGTLMSGAPAAISADGRYVAFTSEAANLVPGDTNAQLDIFTRDRVTGTTERVSLSSDGAQGNGLSNGPALPADGRLVAFQSLASNLVAGDTNQAFDVFVRDQGPAIGIRTLAVSSAMACVLDVSGSATFAGKVIASAADSSTDGNIGANEIGAELTGASLVYRPEQEDLLLLWQVDNLPGTNGTAGIPGVDYVLDITVGGTRYQVVATVPGIFALNRCDADCAQQASLQGSIGTTGENVMVAIPLAALGVSEAAALSDLRAYTVLGDPTGVPLDEVALESTIVPVRSVILGIAPSGTPESQVTFNAPTTLAGGNFSGTLDVSSLSPGDYDVWARACLGETCGPAASVAVAITSCASPVQLLSAVSTKVHGIAGTFDVDLPLTGPPGIECRSGGANNDYTIVVTFANAVTFNSAAVTSGTGTISSTTGGGTTALTVNLTGVTNAQTITVTLSGVNDGTNTGDVGVRIGVLLGDVNASRAVSNTDVSEVKAEVSAQVTASNFRNDVSVNGVLSNTDVSTTKAQVSTTLP